MSQIDLKPNGLDNLPALRRWRDLSLRVKIILALLVIEVVSISVLVFFALTRAGQIVTSVSNKFEESVKVQTNRQLTDIVNSEAANADQLFTLAKDDLSKLADYRAQVESQKFALNQGTYWDARLEVHPLPDGQYTNTRNDLGTVFIPNNTSVNDVLLNDINASAYLDFLAPKVLRDQQEVVAVYYVSALGYTTYYPNIDLASLVPADFDARTQTFYTIAIPQNNLDRSVRWTDPYQDPAGTGLIVTASAPVYNENNIFQGVMSIDMQLGRISENISQIKVGNTGFAFLVDKSGHILVMPTEGYNIFGIQPEEVPVGESPTQTILGQGSEEFQAITSRLVTGESGLSTVVINGVESYVVFTSLKTPGYSLGVIVPTSELNTAIENSRKEIQNETTSSLWTATFILLGLLVVTIVLSIVTGQFIAAPLARLMQTVEQVSSGNLSARAAIESKDETGALATAFNHMASQLSENFATLEARVAERTRNLELAAEVGRSVSQVRDLDIMLKDACELILKEFNLYYVQVYLSDARGSNLKLEAGTGSVGAQLVGRGHSLPLNINSINGRAATEKHAVVISDTAKSATFRKNSLLPDTRGEMAVPLLVANKVVGVLDMQSSQPGVLTEEVLPAFEALAGQLAVAIQNANLLAETEQARAQVEAQARRLVHEGWNEHLDAIHKPEQIGFVFEQNKIESLANEEAAQQPAAGKAISAPIAVTGEALGSLVVELDDDAGREQTSELVNVVARQVAQQIENLRLLESAERYRAEAEHITRIQTVEGWQKYIETRSSDNIAYLYDTKEVRTQVQAEDPFMFSMPLKARDELIGKVSVQGLTDQDQESVELANAVVERLSAHLETLRLFEETRLGQVELDKRARQLASVAEVSSISSRELDIQKMLESVVHLTQRKFGLYHCHVFLYNEETNAMKIAACGWKEGDEHEGTHGTASIPMDQEQSLVARAARTRKAVIVNDVRNEPGWLPNPMLPDTASELAVPLLIGDHVLGVLDVQADRLNAFTEEDASIQTTLASQVATSLQNARSFNQAQSALAQSERLFDASSKLTQATDLQKLVDTAVSTLQIPEINRAILVAFNYGATGNIEGLDVIANWWNETGHQATATGTHYSRDVIQVMPMFVSPTPVFFDDTFSDTRVDGTTMQLVQRLNLRAVAVLPLHAGTTQIGALILEAEVPHHFTPEETRLFIAIAPQIATIMENRRQFEHAQKQAEREAMLNVINQKIQSATSVEAVLQIAARELGHALGAPMTIAQLSMKDRSS